MAVTLALKPLIFNDYTVKSMRCWKSVPNKKCNENINCLIEKFIKMFYKL